MKNKKSKKNNRNVSIGNLCLVFTLFLFLGLLYRASVLSLSKKVDGINLKEFSSSHTLKRESIKAKRGNIYDANGDILAQNVYSYELIAYLEPSRGEGYYVKDKEYTAEQLSTIIDLDKDKILSLLNSTRSNGEPLYQTSFGTPGRGLTEITKDKIKALNLPGIDFIETQKRYYPKGDYLSYTLGYAKQDSNGNITGEMGIEALYNKELTGTDGFREYQKDLKGYKIANTPEIVQEAVDGNDVYLTIDSNVQFFIEQALEDAEAKYTFDELNIVVAEAKTGKILGISSTTGFDPNLRNVSTYLDPNLSVSFEPGSTMKTFTYMAALESGKYDGNTTFKSGTYTTKDGTVIGDSNRSGWGVISFDRGFALSSNVGICNIITSYLSGKELKDYFKKLGFGSTTEVLQIEIDGKNVGETNKETAGRLPFKYETEILNAGFGQGIMVTSFQNIKALTSIANDGILLQPYLVDKVVDSTGKVLGENTRTELGRVASKETTDKIKNLMETVVTEGTGSNYNMPGYNVIAKTGTAQIASTNGKGYLKGESDYIKGFAGMFPKDDPEIIIYANAKRPYKGSVKPLTEVIKSVITNVSKYYNIYDEVEESIKSTSFKLGKYYSKDVNSVKEELEKNGINAVVIGDGDTIVDQYPKAGIVTASTNKVFLLTNYKTVSIPNFKGWSKKDVDTYLKLAKIPYTETGYGYLVEQSLKNVNYEVGMTLELTFEEKYKLVEEKS